VEQIVRIGMDTSKHVFQLHGVNAEERSVLRKKLRRAEMMTFFEKLPPGRKSRLKRAEVRIIGRGSCARSDMRCGSSRHSYRSHT
jgi:transposase